MVDQKKNSRIFTLLSGQRSMEMTILLLLTVPFTAASALTPSYRSVSGSIQRSEVREKGDGPHPEVTAHAQMQRLADLIDSMGVRLRQRRAPQRGCQLGTCQLHNLANTLYQISKTTGKDQSKNAHDPRGYGR